MYTPPMFKPDRAASLAFAQARGFGAVCAWDGNKPIASSLPFLLAYDIVVAARRDRRGYLCFAGLVRLA